MSGTQSFKRFPAIHCWIKHILKGQYSSEDKLFFTIFGKVKRVRIVATIVDIKKFLINHNTNENTFLDDGDSSNLNIEFHLDDSTGLIRAKMFNVSQDKYKEFLRGNIVDIVGKIEQWKGFSQIRPEVIKKVEIPNLILLRNAEIIKKIKFGETVEIPKITEEEFEIDEISNEIDINDLFEEKSDSKIDDFKEKIYLIIKEYSLKKNGISFTELGEFLKISEIKLREYIKNLELESKIYQSDKDIYQTF